jgi:hypothetical protein
LEKENMRNKKLIGSMLLVLFTNVASAQNDNNKTSNTQKAQTAKADVYIINSKKKIIDSLTTNRDTTAAKTKKKSSVKAIIKSS